MSNPSQSETIILDLQKELATAWGSYDEAAIERDKLRESNAELLRVLMNVHASIWHDEWRGNISEISNAIAKAEQDAKP